MSDGCHDIVEGIEMNEPSNVVFRCEAGGVQEGFVFPYTTDNIVCDANIESSTWF